MGNDVTHSCKTTYKTVRSLPYSPLNCRRFRRPKKLYGRKWLAFWVYKIPSNSDINISSTLVEKNVDHSDVVGAVPVRAAPTISSFSTLHLVSMDWAKTTARRGENDWRFGIWCELCWRFEGNYQVLSFCYPTTTTIITTTTFSQTQTEKS